jgi:serine protease SohB
MNEIFWAYGLFLAKAITVVIGIIVVFAFIAAIAISKKKNKESNYIEIENINDKLEELQDNLESELLDKAEYKKLQKERKKQKKLEEKSKKKQKKSKKKNKDIDEEDKPRIFVLTFIGDLEATTTDNLREEVSAILSVAKEQDQVFVKLDSHGGVVHNYGFAAAQLQRIKQHNINLVVSVDLVAASGGYMMACVANKIIAAPFAIVGSIGVLAQLPNFNKLLQKHDVEIEHHTSGEYKTTLTMLGKNTEKGRNKFIQELEDTHGLFKEFVKFNRPVIDLRKIATGEYWYGLQALDLKLIDEVKTSDDYLIEQSKTCNIYSIEYKIHESLKDKLHGALSKATNLVLSKLVNNKNKAMLA